MISYSIFFYVVVSIIKNGFNGFCPQVFCPFGCTQKGNGKHILKHSMWKQLVPLEIVAAHNGFVKSLLSFQCAACHIR